jgi:hypothetical protein
MGDRGEVKITRTGPIIYQKMLIDKRATQPGNWLMLSIHTSKRRPFKWKKFDRVSGYAFFPFYLELSKRSKTFGINLIWINLEIIKHIG